MKKRWILTNDISKGNTAYLAMSIFDFKNKI